MKLLTFYSTMETDYANSNLAFQIDYNYYDSKRSIK